MWQYTIFSHRYTKHRIEKQYVNKRKRKEIDGNCLKSEKCWNEIKKPLSILWEIISKKKRNIGFFNYHGRSNSLSSPFALSQSAYRHKLYKNT